MKRPKAVVARTFHFEVLKITNKFFPGCPISHRKIFSVERIGHQNNSGFLKPPPYSVPIIGPIFDEWSLVTRFLRQNFTVNKSWIKILRENHFLKFHELQPRIWSLFRTAVWIITYNMHYYIFSKNLTEIFFEGFCISGFTLVFFYYASGI